MPKVTFVIVGQSHEDSAVNKSVADTFPGLLQSLQAQNIPVRLAVESGRTRSHDDMIEFNAVHAAEEQIIREGARPPETVSSRIQTKLAEMGVTNLPKPKAYLLTTHLGSAIQKEPFADDFIGEGRGAAYRQELRTFLHAKAKGVPLQALDCNGAELKPFIRSDGSIDVAAAEHTRLQTMTNGALGMITQLAQDKNGPGGVVLALNVGNSHVASFKVMLDEKIKQTAALQGVEVQVEAVPTFSVTASLTAEEGRDAALAELSKGPSRMRRTLPQQPAFSPPRTGKDKALEDFTERVDEVIEAGAIQPVNSADLGVKILAVGTEHVAHEQTRQQTLKQSAAAVSISQPGRITGTVPPSGPNANTVNHKEGWVDPTKKDQKAGAVPPGSANDRKPPAAVPRVAYQAPVKPPTNAGTQQSGASTTTTVMTGTGPPSLPSVVAPPPLLAVPPPLVLAGPPPPRPPSLSASELVSVRQKLAQGSNATTAGTTQPRTGTALRDTHPTLSDRGNTSGPPAPKANNKVG